MTLMPKFRPIHEIAADITRLWKVPTKVKQYVEIMQKFDHIDQYYSQTSARLIVIDFLSNSHGWHGENARKIKAELRKMAQLK